MGDKHKFHAPERILEICSEMRKHGKRMTAYADEIETLFAPIAKTRMAQREYSCRYMVKYREKHPEYRECCRIAASECNRRKREEAKLAAEVGKIQPVNSVTATMCETGEFQSAQTQN